jgi:hypothetical protein
MGVEGRCMSLEKLQAASPHDVAVYAPYYQGRRRNALPLAISLYQAGNLEGVRKIEGGKSIPFIASWSVSSLPSDLTQCRLQFDENAELSYEITLTNFEFVDFLIEVLFYFKLHRIPDFSQAFYRKLLRI